MTWFARLRRRLLPPAADRSHQRLLVDISTIAQHDAGTGIQRVVRAIWLHLYSLDLGSIKLLPVAATARRGYSIAQYDPATGRLSLPDPATPILRAGAGDIFVGLDLAAHRLARHERQLARWRRSGASVNLLVYDLLPLQRPDWFPVSTGRNFRKWIKVLARHADRAICISDQVARDLADWLNVMRAPRREAIARYVIPLSGAIEASRPTVGMGERGHKALERLDRHPCILIVGTIEPRKGHDCLIGAMEHLWSMDGDPPHLVVVGRPGWRTETLQARMAALEEQGDRFTWLRDASDELLSALYARSTLVVVASRGEGFGLPIVEALRHGRKVLARDLLVFRELTRPGLYYFNDDAPEALATRIQETLCLPDPAPWPGDGWEDSARALLHALGLEGATASPVVSSAP